VSTRGHIHSPPRERRTGLSTSLRVSGVSWMCGSARSCGKSRRATGLWWEATLSLQSHLQSDSSQILMQQISQFGALFERQLGQRRIPSSSFDPFFRGIDVRHGVLSKLSQRNAQKVSYTHRVRVECAKGGSHPPNYNDKSKRKEMEARFLNLGSTIPPQSIAQWRSGSYDWGIVSRHTPDWSETR